MWSRSPLLVAAFLAAWAAGFLGCHLEPEEETYLEVLADTSWLAHDSVSVLLADSTGRTLEVLRHGPLDSLEQLERLEVRKFSGGQTVLVLIAYQDGLAVLRETRTYDGRSQTTVERKVEKDLSELNPGKAPKLDLGPDTLLLYRGGSTAVLKPAPAASWEGKFLDWSTSDAGVAVVSRGVVTPVGPGTARIRARSGNSEDSVTVIVAIDAPVLWAGSDTLVLAPATLAFRVRVTQEHGSIALFKWSLDGDTAWDDSLRGFPESQATLITDVRRFTLPGQYLLLFLVEDGEGNQTRASRMLTVIGSRVPQAPIAFAGPDIMVEIGTPVTLTGSSSDPDGDIVRREWLAEGSSIPLRSSDTYAFQAGVLGAHRYIFRVIDKDGLSASDTVQVTVVLEDGPPVLFGIEVADDFPSDGYRKVFTTLLSANGTALTCYWDYDGNGIMDEVSMTGSKGNGELDTLMGYFEYQFPGEYWAELRVVDGEGRMAVGGVWVTVAENGENGLTSLSLSAGTLFPDFQPAIQDYSAQVPPSSMDIRFTAVAKSEHAVLRVNGVEIANGALSQNFPLLSGVTNFELKVHNPNGVVMYYNIKVSRGIPIIFY